MEAAIMPNAIQTGHRQTGLIGVYFPGVDVECRGVAAVAGLPEGATNHRVGKLSKIPATCRGYGIGEDARRRKWEFSEPTGLPHEKVRHTLRGWISVPAATYREET